MEKELEKDNRKDKSSDSSDRNILQKIKCYVWKSNGFLTKAKGWIDKTEWHAVAISSSWAALPFLMPSPMDAIFVITYAIYMKRIVEGDAFEGTQLNDPVSQFAYNLPVYTLTVFLLTEHTRYSIQSIEVGRIIVSMFAGA